ncbi:golgin subfamily A member 6-like protein 2 [Manihot esculenta]|uniref:golgin subfamily A member 6-like protein 2 n=1 Tax=Manihot esculenta TaxID=3983 RepID=UPI001CC7BDBE|nr:golgin subfamily A member 6-like protein 2 [Manihot esculenta]
MDKIKPPKNFTLSRESMKAALGAFRAGRFMSKATQDVAQVISSRSAGRSAHPAPASSRAPKLSSRGVRTSKPSSRSSSSSLPRSSQATGSQQAATTRTKVAPKITDRPAEDPGHVRAGAASSFGDAPEERFEVSLAGGRAPEGEVEIGPAGENVQEAAIEAAPVDKGISVEGAESEPVMGLFMDVDARDRSLRDTVDHRIEEARHKENLSATSDARGHLATAQEHLKTLKGELSYTVEALKRADEKAVEAETRRDKALEQLSSLREVWRERDEAVGQRNEVWHQYQALKADFEGAQGRYDTVMAQRDEALARIVVLEQELSKHADTLKDLTLVAEESKLQNQQLYQEVKEYRGSAELRADIDQACQRRLLEYKGSSELKAEIEQACEDRLQLYQDSSKLKAKIEEACEARLAEFKASDELKNEIWHRGFRMFASGFNRGLKEARDDPSTPLARLQAPEVDSDGEEVCYGEDDNPLPKGASHTATGPFEEDAELEEGEEKETAEPEESDARLQGEDAKSSGEDAGPQGGEIVPFMGVGGSGQESTGLPKDSSVDNINDDIINNVSPLRTIFPPVVIDD